MNLRCGSFNVLADAYLSYGDYSGIDPTLLVPGARLPGLLRLIEDLKADVLGLQEVEAPLVHAISERQSWQMFWSPKGRNTAVGCLTLVKQGIEASNFKTHHYSDEARSVMQTVHIGKSVFANTHIKWAARDDPNHIGITQTTELLEQLGLESPTVIFADCNDQPDGPVRKLIEEAGFTYVSGNEPTALIDHEPVALDIIAVRGIKASRIATSYKAQNIPNQDCPSDHIPILANISVV